MVSDDRWFAFQKTKSEIEDAVTLLKSVAMSPQVTLIDPPFLRNYSESSQKWNSYGFAVQKDGIVRRYAVIALKHTKYLQKNNSANEMLRYPGVTCAKLIPVIERLGKMDPQVLARVDIDGSLPLSVSSLTPDVLLLGRYSAHLLRQEADLRIFMEDESLLLDPQMDYSQVAGLSSEVKERLFAVRPTTIVCENNRS